MDRDESAVMYIVVDAMKLVTVVVAYTTIVSATSYPAINLNRTYEGAARRVRGRYRES